MSEMGKSVQEYYKNVGMTGMAVGIAGVVKDTIVNNVDKVVDGAVLGLAASVPPFTSVAMPLVGGLIKSVVQVSTDVLHDAAEYAAYKKDVDNAFSNLYEVLSFKECLQQWKDTTHEAGRISRYEQNRGRLERLGDRVYRAVRVQELLKSTGETADNAAALKRAEEYADDEIRLHHARGGKRDAPCSRIWTGRGGKEEGTTVEGKKNNQTGFRAPVQFFFGRFVLISTSSISVNSVWNRSSVTSWYAPVRNASTNAFVMGQTTPRVTSRFNVHTLPGVLRRCHDFPIRHAQPGGNTITHNAPGVSSSFRRKPHGTKRMTTDQKIRWTLIRIPWRLPFTKTCLASNTVCTAMVHSCPAPNAQKTHTALSFDVTLG